MRIWFALLESFNHRGFCNKQEGERERKSEDGREYSLRKFVTENGEEF